MPDCSAIPARLQTYGKVGGQNDTALAGSAKSLSTALNVLTLSRPDPTVLPKFDDWGQDLARYAHRKSQVDAWVKRVGDAFEAAGNGKGIAPAKLVTVDPGRLEQLIVARDPKVAAALEYYRQHIDDDSFIHGDRSSLEGIDDRLKGLTPEQLDEFMRSLSDDELRKWNAKIADQHDILTHHEGLDGGDRVALANLLFANLSPDQLDRVRKLMPSLQPDPKSDEIHDGFTWKSTSGIPLYGDGGVPKPSDIDQGDLGDCWFLSALGSMARTPEGQRWIMSHIRQNPNGTYTVTFYKDGKPVEITVTDDMPYSSKPGFDYPYDHDNQGTGKWAMIYEKAYAQFKGGYGNIEGGFGNTGLSDLTGKDATKVGAGDESLADIDYKLRHGYAMTAGTSNAFPIFGDETPDNNKLVAGHEYMIQSVDLKHHTITLINPWGADGSAPHYVTLTEQEFEDNFREVSYVPMN